MGGSLQDGNFSLIMDSSKIHDATGGLLDGDGDGLSGGARAADAFFRLFGDSDGDRDVDNLDLFRFRQSFGLTSSDAGYKSYFDFDGDGDVDNLDLFRLRQRFGTTLAP
jgi:Dockerin type I domain